MNYCYHYHRLPWPPPSPFPLRVTINLPPSRLLLKDSQTPPLASPVLLKAENKGTRPQGRRERGTASHCLTCTLALRSPRTPWKEPSFWRRTSFSFKYSMAFFLTFQNSPSPEISSWTGNGLLKLTIYNDPGTGSSLELFQAIREASGEYF